MVEEPLKFSERGWWSRSLLPVALVALALGLSLFIFSHNAAYHTIVENLEEWIGVLNLGYSADFVLTMLFLVLLFLGVWSVRALRAVLRISWVIFGLSVAAYASLDFILPNSDSFFSSFHNDLGMAWVLVNGIVLVAANIYLRSWLQMTEIKKKLALRGPDKGELNRAIDGDLRYIMTRILLASGMAAAVGLIVWYGSAFLQQFDPIVIGSLFSLIALIVTVALLAILLYQIREREKIVDGIDK